VSAALFVSVIGWSGTGKTTLIVRALEECLRRGIAASAAKRARHEADIDPGGKDSARFLVAGARASLYVGDRTSARFTRSPGKQDAAFYSSFLTDERLVFLEGTRVDGAVTVQVAGSAHDQAGLKLPLSDCDILIAEDPAAFVLEGGRPRIIAPAAIGEFMDYLEARRGT
jgi:molybdopterin-guanine dinucleotide biosynthesis protein MobB